MRITRCGPVLLSPKIRGENYFSSSFWTSLIKTWGAHPVILPQKSLPELPLQNKKDSYPSAPQLQPLWLSVPSRCCHLLAMGSDFQSIPIIGKESQALTLITPSNLTFPFNQIIPVIYIFSSK